MERAVTPPLPSERPPPLPVVPLPPPVLPPPPLPDTRIDSLTSMVAELRDSVFALNYQLQQQQELLHVPRSSKLKPPPSLDDGEEKKVAEP